MCDNNYEELTQLVKSHLELKKLNLTSDLWRIQDSPLGGRGIFVKRDIKPGEVILIDHPLIIGPRINKNFPVHCVICSRSSGLVVCSKACGLPVCSDNCELSSTHQTECDLIRKWTTGQKMDDISMELFYGLTPLRAILLNEERRQLLINLISHDGRYHGIEVDLVKQKIKLEENDEKFMRKVCCILDSNAFEIKVTGVNIRTKLRGLYPLSSLMNHSCAPNTTYMFDEDQRMIVKATVAIKKDSEIYHCYVDPLWGTVSRRHILAITKYFWCQCRRCKDPTEFGTSLNGLKCISSECQGVLLPIDPLENCSEWHCASCQSLVTRQKIGTMLSALANFLKTVDLSNIDDMMDFIKNRLSKFVPVHNQMAVELKTRIIRMLGHTERYCWGAVTLDQLNYKEELCRDILQMMMDLQLGQWKLRGFILYELYRCQVEKSLRTALSDNLKEIEGMQRENKEILKEAAEILANDRSAPSEIKTFNKCQNEAKF